MATYKGKTTLVNQPIADVYAKISNLGDYQQRIDSLPSDIRAKLGEVSFTPDSIIISAQPVGQIKFTVTERTEPSILRLEAEQSPVPFAIAINLTPASDSSTNVATELNVDIPAMLKPMVGGKLQEAADKFGDLMTTLFA